MSDKLTPEILVELAQPFRADQVRWKPQVISETGNALAVAYVDPRVVSERLDLATGGDWSFRWEPMGIHGDRLVIKSILTVLGVTREDVGEYVVTDRDQADPWKSAVSDSLKRAAVLFGVGRYLYWLESIWCSYDRRKKEFIDEPYIDDEGVVRVRRRQGERDRVLAETRVSDRRPGTSTSPARPASRTQPTGDGRGPQQHMRVQESRAETAYGVPWGEDLVSWATRYLEHQGLSTTPPADVIDWLVQNNEMQADLSSYSALSDAQAAFIRGLPKYREAHEQAA
jgi:hypothetical protein